MAQRLVGRKNKLNGLTLAISFCTPFVEILKNIDIELSFNVHFFGIENIELKSMSMSVQTLNSHATQAKPFLQPAQSYIN